MGAEHAQRTPPPRTAQDAPIAVRVLLKSYDPAALRWDVADERYAVVIAILTRGDADAQAWLRSILSHEEVRELVRSYGGASSAEPERAILREQFALTTDEIPVRPYLGFRWRPGT